MISEGYCNCIINWVIDNPLLYRISFSDFDALGRQATFLNPKFYQLDLFYFFRFMNYSF